MRLHHAWFLLALVGCDDDGDDDDDFATVSCADLSGQFVAQDLFVTGLDDRGTFSDFGDSDFTIGFDGPSFASTFDNATVPSFGQAGDVRFDGVDLFLGDRPVVPGLAPGGQRFQCVFDGRTLDLSSTTAFDFDGDGRFEDALFEARLEAIDPAGEVE